MEVHLESTNQVLPPEDTYVAVRIGDVQKQSRFETSRTYKFAPAKDAQLQFGRIEVFKRVGYLTVSLDEVARDLMVPCGMPGYPEVLHMKMSMMHDGQAKPAKENLSNTKAALDTAQRYIDSYQVEEILAEAMREVLRHRPEDPNRFLSDHFLRRSETGPLKPRAPSKVQGAAPPRSRPASSVKKPTEAADADRKPGATEKAPDFRHCPPAYWANLHQAFPQKARQEAPPAALASRSSDVKFMHKPSVGGMFTVLRPLQKRTALTEQAHAPVEMQPVSFAKKPSVGTWLAAPVVGTDDIITLRRKMRDGVLQAATQGCLKQALLGLPSPDEPAFDTKPSVGSWLKQTPDEVTRPWYYQPQAGDKAAYIAELQRLLSTREEELSSARREIQALRGATS